MKPIWYFVGLILLTIGGIIFLNGIYQLISPPETKTVLAETHPAIWWGIIMVVSGLLLYLTNRNKIIS